MCVQTCTGSSPNVHRTCTGSSPNVHGVSDYIVLRPKMFTCSLRCSHVPSKFCPMSLPICVHYPPLYPMCLHRMSASYTCLCMCVHPALRRAVNSPPPLYEDLSSSTPYWHSPCMTYPATIYYALPSLNGLPHLATHFGCLQGHLSKTFKSRHNKATGSALRGATKGWGAAEWL